MAKGSLGAGLKQQIAAETASEADSTKTGPAKDGQAGDSSHAVQPKSRVGLKAMTFYFPIVVSRELKKMAADEDTTMQALVAEALDLLRRSRNQHPFGHR